MEKNVRAMMDLIAYEVCGKEVDIDKLRLSDEDLAALYKLSKSHDLAHIVGDALIKNGLIKNPEIEAKYQKQILLAVYRYEKINYELQCLTNALSEAKIEHVPLKGSVIRQYYPEPWMRTSCDIDILVRESDVTTAAQVIVEKLGFTYENRNYHDISMKSPAGVHLELHFSIKENKENIDRLLSEDWSNVTAGDGYTRCFTNEFFLFHQFAHASYHFLSGGCGVRPFLDLYLLNQHLSFYRPTLDCMLKQTGIATFADKMAHLSEVWFGCGEHDEVTHHMEQFVLFGGVYGNTQNSIAVKQQTEKGRLGYLWNRLWLPYDSLKRIYPRLDGRRYLQLFYEVKRWCRIFNPTARKQKSRELRAIRELSAEKRQSVHFLLKELELL